MYLSCGTYLKDLTKDTRCESSQVVWASRRISSKLSQHCVRFPSTCLTIREAASIVPLHNIANQWLSSNCMDTLLFVAVADGLFLHCVLSSAHTLQESWGTARLNSSS